MRRLGASPHAGQTRAAPARGAPTVHTEAPSRSARSPRCGLRRRSVACPVEQQALPATTSCTTPGGAAATRSSSAGAARFLVNGWWWWLRWGWRFGRSGRGWVERQVACQRAGACTAADRQGNNHSTTEQRECPSFRFHAALFSSSSLTGHTPYSRGQSSKLMHRWAAACAR